MHPDSDLLVDVLPPILHSSEAQCRDDDWSGLRDRAERRKRQNRLNVRAHRKRKALESRQREQIRLSKEHHLPWATPGNPSGSAPSIQFLQWLPPVKSPKQSFAHRLSASEPPSDEEIHQKSCVAQDQIVVHAPTRHPARRLCPVSKPTKRLPPYYRSPAHWFPLYRDHLIPLVFYNVFRATITNIHILSLTSLLESPCTPDLHTTPLFPAPSNIPPTLFPTELQRSTPHEPWIDIFPSGAMRDNAIRYRDRFDHHELCSDLVGCQEAVMCWEQPGIIAWSDPWHPDGWEVTEKFVEKWSFLLKGCEDVMRATNTWRAMRDEEPLVWELE